MSFDWSTFERVIPDRRPRKPGFCFRGHPLTPGVDCPECALGRDRARRRLRQLGTTTARSLVDISEMPGFDPKVPNGARSVSGNLVYFGLPRSNGGLLTVCCIEHGAILCVAKNEAGKIWRCPACNEGAFEPASPDG